MMREEQHNKRSALDHKRQSKLGTSMKKLCPHSTPTISQALDCAQHELCQPYIRRDKGFNILARINTANLMQNLVDDGLAVVFLHQEDDELGKWRGEVFEVREQVQDARCRSKVKMELPDGHAKKSKHRSPGVRILGHGWWSCGGVCDTEMMQVSNCVCVCACVSQQYEREYIWVTICHGEWITKYPNRRLHRHKVSLTWVLKELEPRLREEIHKLWRRRAACPELGHLWRHKLSERVDARAASQGPVPAVVITQCGFLAFAGGCARCSALATGLVVRRTDEKVP